MSSGKGSTQERFLDNMKKISEGADFETTVDFVYANTGTLYAWNKGSFSKPIARMSFSFQSDYASITIWDFDECKTEFPYCEYAKGKLSDVSKFWVDLMVEVTESS